jgi:hypothetical protein
MLTRINSWAFWSNMYGNANTTTILVCIMIFTNMSLSFINIQTPEVGIICLMALISTFSIVISNVIFKFTCPGIFKIKSYKDLMNTHASFYPFLQNFLKAVEITEKQQFSDLNEKEVILKELNHGLENNIPNANAFYICRQQLNRLKAPIWIGLFWVITLGSLVFGTLILIIR